MLALIERTRTRERMDDSPGPEAPGAAESTLLRVGESRARADRLADRSTATASPGMIREEEKQAVIRMRAGASEGWLPQAGLAEGRRGCGVREGSPSSVYRILNDADLLYRWKRTRGVGEPPPSPGRPNERWHTDIMYLRVEGTWYFLVTVLDGYSRFVVHWELLTSMKAADVRLVIQQALENTGAKPQVVSDNRKATEPKAKNGAQFTAGEFKDLAQAVRAGAHPHPHVPSGVERDAGALPSDHLRGARRGGASKPLEGAGAHRKLGGALQRASTARRARLPAAGGVLPAEIRRRASREAAREAGAGPA